MTRRALVLGGGGLAGIGWEWGILAGLAEAGVRLGDADLVVGTSAGSVVGAQIAHGADPQERYEAQLAPPDGEIAAAFGRKTMLRWGLAMVGSRSPQRIRQRIGKLARTATTEATEAERIAVIGSRLPVTEWPAGTKLLITAVDTETGAFKAFGRDDGVPLVTAVASSCAVPGVWPPVTIDGKRYMDGGMRSSANADLADGYDRVIVIAPVASGFGPMPSPRRQVEELRRESEVALVTPDADAVNAFGSNLLDPAVRAAAAQAGRAQAASLAGALRTVWD
jgi:NTE family protein